ncbi:MAG: PD40 domain-containing protein, partial [Acidobacteria bacterium]|nr:PD40 domain-containing protein [Acidobacteriota bacterium]
MKQRTMRLITLLVFLLVFSLASGAEERHPLTFDDLIAFARVSDPQVSPDGRWVVYVVDHYDKAANSRSSDLWLVAAEGSEPRQRTRSGKRDRRPRWSPDGTEIAFLSNRDAKWQIWT